MYKIEDQGEPTSGIYRIAGVPLEELEQACVPLLQIHRVVPVGSNSFDRATDLTGLAE
jgi:hypothetical protein